MTVYLVRRSCHCSTVTVHKYMKYGNGSVFPRPPEETGLPVWKTTQSLWKQAETGISCRTGEPQVVHRFHVSIFEKRGSALQLQHCWPAWLKRHCKRDKPPKHQRPCYLNFKESIGNTVAGQGSVAPPQRPEEPVYAKGLRRILWIRPCEPKYKQGRMSIRQRPYGKVFQHIKKWMRQSVRFLDRGGTVSDGRRICLCDV